jgi:hypothetical protein
VETLNVFSMISDIWNSWFGYIFQRDYSIFTVLLPNDWLQITY